MEGSKCGVGELISGGSVSGLRRKWRSFRELGIHNSLENWVSVCETELVRHSLPKKHMKGKLKEK